MEQPQEPNEEWRPIEEAPGYLVSNLGNVKGKRGTLLAQNVNQFGYKTVSPYVNGKTLYRQAHRLVAQAFIPNPDGLPIVNHKDGNRLNNCVTNLEWVTAKQNANKIVNPAVDNPRRSRKVVQIKDGQVIRTWPSIGEAANAAGLSRVNFTKHLGKKAIVDREGCQWVLADKYEKPNEPEEWKTIEVDQETFTVSTLGRIRLADGQIITGRLKGEYCRYRTHGVHRLIAMAFCEHPAGADVVNHKDGNPANNRATNLEWTTQKDNCVHANATGLCRRKPVRRTLPSGAQVDYASIQAASRASGVSAGDIVGACKGEKRRPGGSAWEYLVSPKEAIPEECSSNEASQPADATHQSELNNKDFDELMESILG